MSQSIKLFQLIGLNEGDADELVDAWSMTMRVYKREGRAQICTRDYRTDRVNVNIENGIVHDAHYG